MYYEQDILLLFTVKMKKLSFFLMIIMVFLGFCSAEMTYQDFLKNLKQSGINTTEIQQKESISRYELTRLLNASECKNCINPDISFISTYTPEYRQTFVVSPDKNFSDITAPMTQFL